MNDPSGSPSTLLLWASLKAGDIVELRQRGKPLYAGVVDDRNRDGTVIWLVDDLAERRLFHVADGFDLHVIATSDGSEDATQSASTVRRVKLKGRRLRGQDNLGLIGRQFLQRKEDKPGS